MSETKKILGSVNSDGIGKIFGWAVNPVGKKPKIEILVNGKIISTVAASEYRKDIESLGHSPDGLCGFLTQYALKPLDYVEGRVKGTRAYLPKVLGSGIVKREHLMDVVYRVGIGVITYNRLGFLKNCISNIRRYSSLPYYLVVADDGSQDGTLEWCESEGITVIHGANKGCAWNKNRALYFLLNNTDCDVILLIEDDCWPSDPGWLQAWSLAARKFGHICDAHPSIHGNTGAIVSGRGTPIEPFVSKLATAPCTACSREALESVGYLDSRFRGYGAEHVEWSMRFNKKYPVIVNGSERPDLFLVMHTGLEEHDGPSSADQEQITRNRLLRQSMTDDPVYKDPWSSDAERDEFLKEQVNKVVPAVMPMTAAASHQKTSEQSLQANSSISAGKSQTFRKRILFAHVPKTAGTSFRSSVCQAVSNHEVLADYGQKNGMTSKNIQDAIYGSQQIDFFSLCAMPWKILFSHFQDTKLKLPGYIKAVPEATLATIVRDPLQRIVSEFFHFKNNYGYNKPFEVFIDEPRFINRQRLSIGNVPLSSFEYIGITERYADSLSLFKELYGIELAEQRVNVRDEKSSEIAMAPEQIKKFCKSNLGDIALYNEALALFSRLIRESPSIVADARFRGAFSLLPSGIISGWAVDYSSFWPVRVCFRSDDGKVLYERACVYREDVRVKRLHLSGYCGFEISVNSLKKRLGEAPVIVAIENGPELGRLFGK
jgi:hypothetical protein